MAYRVLLVGRELGHGVPRNLVGSEERVVAEAAFTLEHGADGALARPLGRAVFAQADQCDHTHEARSSIGDPLELLQEELVVGLVRGLRREPLAVHARGSAEGLDLEARVVGHTGKTDPLVHEVRLLEGVAHEGVAGLGRVFLEAEVGERRDLDSRSFQDSSGLFGLVSVVGGEHQLHRVLADTRAVQKKQGVMAKELEVLVSQLDELLNSPIVDEDDALEVAIVAGLAARLGATPSDLAEARLWRDGAGADLLASMWEQVDLGPLLEEVDDCTGGGRDDEQVEEAVYDVDDVIAAAIWCGRTDVVRGAARELAGIIRGVPDVFEALADEARQMAASREVAEHLGLYDYWLALADTAPSDRS